MLWCDGLKLGPSDGNTAKQPKRVELDGDEQGSTRKKNTAQQMREECVQNALESLKVKHGTSFNPMQFCILSEHQNSGTMHTLSLSQCYCIIL